MSKILVDHVNVINFNDMELNIPKSISNGWTVGLWMFVEDQTAITGLINVILAEHMVISIGLDTNIANICNIYVAQNPSIATQTSASNLKTLITSLGANTISATAKFAEDKSKKWFHVSCAFSFDFGSMYARVSHDSSPVPVITTTPITFETRWKDTALDNHFRKYFWNTSDLFQLKLKGMSGFSGTKSVFMKYVNVYKDMLPSNIGIHYL